MENIFYSNSNKIGNNYESTLRAYVGKNSDYFINQFKNIESSNKANYSWIWFIGGLWLLYRKMYSYFILSLIPIVNIFIYINLIFNSNKIYYKSICKKIEKDGLTSKDIANQEIELAKAKKHGGTSYVGIIVFLVITVLITIILYVSIFSMFSTLYYFNNIDSLDDKCSNINDESSFIANSIVSSIEYWIGDNAVTQDSYNFILNNKELFPTDIYDESKISKIISNMNDNGYYIVLDKNINPHKDSFVNTAGEIVQIEEFEIDGELKTYIILCDYEDYVWEVIYNGQVDYYKNDHVQVFGLPICKNSYENISGSTTNSIVLLGAIVTDQDI